MSRVGFRQRWTLGGLWLLAIVLVAWFHAPAAAAPTFTSDLYMVAAPYTFAVTDLDRDGHPDLIGDNGVLDVTLGNGDGDFQPTATYPDGNSYQSIRVVADVNGDGYPDLVSAGGYAYGNVVVHLANGHGGYAAPVTFTGPSGVAAVFVADADSDGRADIIESSGEGISVLLGNGDGTFQPRIDTPRDTTIAFGSAALADFDGDGRPDLAIARSDASLRIFHGTGDGRFTPAARTQLYPYLGYNGLLLMYPGDLDGDGRADLVSAQGDSSITVWYGAGDGTFTGEEVHVTGPDNYGVSTVLAYDLDHDGRPELIASTVDRTVFLHRQAGGEWRARTLTAVLSIVGFGDIDGDGRTDMVAALGDRTGILFDRGQGVDALAAHVPVAATPPALAIGDLDRDGRADVVTTGPLDSIVVLWGGGGGTIAARTTLDAGPAPEDVAIADLDGDGRPDIAITNGERDSYATNSYVVGNTVSVFYSDGGRTFASRRAFTTSIWPRRLAVADVNDDGRLDLVCTHADLPPLIGTTAGVLLNAGARDFAPDVEYAVGPQPYGVRIADLNGDGVPNIVTGNSFGHSMSILVGRGDGTFVADGSGYIDTPAAPITVATGRLDADTLTDVVFTTGTSVYAAFQSRPGVFRTPVLVTKIDDYAQTLGVELADVDRDGMLDLVVSTGSLGYVQVMKGHNGSFSEPRLYGVVGGAFALAVGDIDGDHWPDIATASSGSVALLFGRADATTATLAAFVSAAMTPDGVRLTWAAGDASGGRVLRTDDGTGWKPIGDAVRSGDWIVFDDTDVVPGARHGYRLEVGGQGGYVTAIAWVDVPAGDRLAVHVAGANPVRGALALDLDLPSRGPASVELIDVAGRRALVRSLPGDSRLRRRVDVPETRALAAGVYWIRVSQGADAVSRRVVMVR